MWYFIYIEHLYQSIIFLIFNPIKNVNAWQLFVYLPISHFPWVYCFSCSFCSFFCWSLFQPDIGLGHIHCCCKHINFAFIKCLYKTWSSLVLLKKLPLNTLSGIILNYVCISTHMIVLFLELTARKSFIFSE